MFSKLVSTILVFFSCNALAGTMGVDQPCNHWKIGGHALYLEALLGDYSYSGNYV